MIDDPDKARRLANAICADIRLYHRAAVEGAAPAERTRLLAAPVAEGYELYVSRVSEPNRGLFEEAASAMYAELGAPFHGLPTVPVAAHPPVPGRDRPTSAAVPLVIAVAAAVAVLAIGAAMFLLGAH